MRSGHRTKYLHIINRFIAETPYAPPIQKKNLWLDVDRIQFGNWLQPSNDEVIASANDNWEIFTSRKDNTVLKDLFLDTEHNVEKSNITFLKPLFHRQTLTYEDVQHSVEIFYYKYIEPHNRQYAIVSGDQQVWIKLWLLHLKDPQKYHWLIPVPGEWHWTWHILKAIFKMYYSSMLLPLSKVLRFSSLDPEAKNFHYAEDFLEMVTIAVQKWIQSSLAAHPDKTVMQWLHELHSKNRNAYELAYACIHYFIPYWITCSSIKWNKMSEMEKWWRYWIHLFIATGI